MLRVQASAATGPRSGRGRVLMVEPLEDRRLLAVLVNGDFEAGDLSGWNTFLTSNGSLGVPGVLPMDIDGDGAETAAVRFNAGELVGRNQQEGGGLYQAFEAEGPVLVRADVASDNRGKLTNSEGGVFSLLVDGVTVATHDFAQIGTNSIERTTPAAQLSIGAGLHEIRVLVTRPFIRADFFSPYQWVDNVSVELLNSPPQAGDDLVNVGEDTAWTFDVTANDQDPDGNLDPSSAVPLAALAHGTLVHHGDGTFTYTPDPDFHGEDGFSYQVSDALGASATAEVRIVVEPQQDAMDDEAEVDEDHQLMLDPLANDTFEDPAAVVTSVSQAAHGSVELAADGTLTYTPDPGFHGVDQFTYTVTAAQGASLETAEVRVQVHSVVDATIDVKPGNRDEVDRVKLRGRSRTPIAILSTSTADGEAEDFDATLVDWSQATFTINSQAVTPVKLELEDVDDDGDLDLLLHFLTRDLADILSEDTVDLVLGAEFGGGALGVDLEGWDAIEVLSRQRRHGGRQHDHDGSHDDGHSHDWGERGRRGGEERGRRGGGQRDSGDGERDNDERPRGRR